MCLLYLVWVNSKKNIFHLMSRPPSFIQIWLVKFILHFEYWHMPYLWEFCSCHGRREFQSPMKWIKHHTLPAPTRWLPESTFIFFPQLIFFRMTYINACWRHLHVTCRTQSLTSWPAQLGCIQRPSSLYSLISTAFYNIFSINNTHWWLTWEGKILPLSAISSIYYCVWVCVCTKG